MPRGIYPRTEEHKRKISETLKRYPLWNRGKYFSSPLSKEIKEKMSKVRKDWWQKCNYRGSNHHLWTGGKKSYWKKIANKVYREFNINVICEKYGSSINICIHHRDENCKNNNIENLQALCIPCHLRLHNKMRKEIR